MELSARLSGRPPSHPRYSSCSSTSLCYGDLPRAVRMGRPVAGLAVPQPLAILRGPGESYSDVILRLVELENTNN